MRCVQSSPPRRCLVEPLIAGWRRHQELEENAAGSGAWLRRETYLSWALCSRNSSVSTARCCPDSWAHVAVFLRGTRLTLLLRPTPSGALPVGKQHGFFLCGLTFELTWSQRRDARPRPQKMVLVPAAWAWWHAVGSQVERGVRLHLYTTDSRISFPRIRAADSRCSMRVACLRSSKRSTCGKCQPNRRAKSDFLNPCSTISE
jgi:hypothetical protein